MGQEVPNQSEADHMDDEPPLADALASVADDLHSGSEPADLASELEALSGQFETLTGVMDELREQAIGTDGGEVSRAIEEINAESKSRDGATRDAQEVGASVSTLYEDADLEAKRKLLEEHNLRIVQQLLASDTGALSPTEVAFRNEGLISESTVRDHLRTLAVKDFVEKLEPAVETVPNTMPQTFYAATPSTIEHLHEMGLWENLGMLYQLYESLERPAHISAIEEWEERPTPDWI